MLFFLYPFLSLLFYVGEWGGVSWSEWGPVGINTFFQSLGSALLSLGLGFYGARGMLYLRNHFFWKKFYRFLELWVLLPNFLPALFLILPVLKWIWPLTSSLSASASASASAVAFQGGGLETSWISEWMGLTWRFGLDLLPLIIVHTLANTGLVSVGLARIMQQKSGNFALLAQVEGASFGDLFWPLVLYLKRDLFLLGFFVFTLSFSSFSAPLLLAGERGVTLELLIYQKLRGGDLSQALSLAFLQSLFLLSLGGLLWWFRSSSSSSSSSFWVGETETKKIHQGNEKISPLLVSSRGWFIPCSLTLWVVFAQGWGFIEGWRQLQALDVMKEGLFWTSLWGTLRLGLLTGIIVYGLLLLLLFLSPQKKLQNFLLAYTTPSASLTGLAFFLFFPSTLEAWGWSGGFWKLALSLCLCFFPYLYRLHWHGQLQNFQRQREVALTLGAGRGPLFFSILLPQSSSLAAYMAGIAAFWACGDFALSSLLAGEETHLALLMSHLLTRHHVLAATALAPLLLFISLLCYFVFWFLGYVHRKKYVL